MEPIDDRRETDQDETQLVVIRKSIRQSTRARLHVGSVPGALNAASAATIVDDPRDLRELVEEAHGLEAVREGGDGGRV